MSGHSKWATIKRQKGANDAKRGALFTKLSKAITLAVSAGGGVADPAQNFRLRLAVDAAKAGNMPKDTIERAIEKAAGKNGAVLQEAMYEGFGPGGVGILVEAATDNKNRTTSEIQNVFNKYGGNMGAMGSVAYQFKKMGQLAVEKGSKTYDDIFLESADAGAEDVEDADSEVLVYTQPTELIKAKDALTGKGIAVADAELVWKPTMTVGVDDATGEKVMTIMEKLEELDDVVKTYSNMS